MSWEIQKLYYLKDKLLFSSISGGPGNLSKYLVMSVGILTLQVRRYKHKQILLECQAGKVLQHGKYQAHSGKSLLDPKRSTAAFTCYTIPSTLQQCKAH